MEVIKTNWVFDKVTDGEDVYDMTLKVSEQPTAIGLNGGKIRTLIIKKNDKPFYIYDKGKVELDSTDSESILAIACAKYNLNKNADYYLDKLLAPGTGVTGINLELVTIPTNTVEKFKNIYKDLNGLLNTIDSLSSGNIRALITLDFKGKQYLMCADNSSLFVYAERDLPLKMKDEFKLFNMKHTQLTDKQEYKGYKEEE